MASGYWAPLAVGTADGPTLTAAAAATCLPITAAFTFPPNAIGVGTVLRVKAMGRCSQVITTPGTFRLDVRLGGLVILDSGPLAMETSVARTTEPWWAEAMIVCRAVGIVGTASFFGFWNISYSGLVGGVLGSAGDVSTLISAGASGPDAAPAATTLANTTISNTLDLFFTQTVATGSLTVHNYVLESGSVALT